MSPKDESRDEWEEESKEVTTPKKVSLTKESQVEKEEKLVAAERAKLVKKTVEKLDIVSNILFLFSFALIIFIILRYLFYVCYGLGQCEEINWFLIVGILAVLVVFLIIVRMEKSRVKAAISRLKKKKGDQSLKQGKVYTGAKLREFLAKTTVIKGKIAQGGVNLKDAYRDLYLIYKSFLSEFLQIPKAMSTTELIEHINANEKISKELKEYSAKLLKDLFKLNYSSIVDEKELLTFAEASEKVMLYFLAGK